MLKACSLFQLCSTHRCNKFMVFREDPASGIPGPEGSPSASPGEQGNIIMSKVMISSIADVVIMSTIITIMMMHSYDCY